MFVRTSVGEISGSGHNIAMYNLFGVGGRCYKVPGTKVAPFPRSMWRVVLHCQRIFFFFLLSCCLANFEHYAYILCFVLCYVCRDETKRRRAWEQKDGVWALARMRYKHECVCVCVCVCLDRLHLRFLVWCGPLALFWVDQNRILQGSAYSAI
jgi:hypothetical protein